MPQWGTTNLNVMMLSTQTDADSPWSQFVADKMRLMIEQQMLLTYGTDHSTDIASLTSSTDTVITTAASSYTVDQFNGMTLLITTGLAKGYMYTIDDVSTSTGGGAKLTLTGDNAYADGVRSTDTYRILYDQLSNKGHSHDNVNSQAVAAVADDAINETHLDNVTRMVMNDYATRTISTTTAFNTAWEGSLYRTTAMQTAIYRGELYDVGNFQSRVRVNVGAAYGKNQAGGKAL